MIMHLIIDQSKVIDLGAEQLPNNHLELVVSLVQTYESEGGSSHAAEPFPINSPEPVVSPVQTTKTEAALDHGDETATPNTTDQSEGT